MRAAPPLDESRQTKNAMFARGPLPRRARRSSQKGGVNHEPTDTILNEPMKGDAMKVLMVIIGAGTGMKG